MPRADMKEVAGVIIRNDQGEYLLVKESVLHAYGLWNLPAGHIDMGETPAQAAVREAKEEVGLDVEIADDDLCYEEEDVKKNMRFYAFRANIVGGELIPLEGEILDAQWLSFEAVTALNNQNKIRAPWVFNGINQAERANTRH